jgi:hypothetical protein
MNRKHLTYEPDVEEWFVEEVECRENMNREKKSREKEVESKRFEERTEAEGMVSSQWATQDVLQVIQVIQVPRYCMGNTFNKRSRLI